MGKKVDKAAEVLVIICVLVLMGAVVCGLFKWVEVISGEVESTRLGQKIEYWLGDPNDKEDSND